MKDMEISIFYKKYQTMTPKYKTELNCELSESLQPYVILKKLTAKILLWNAIYVHTKIWTKCISDILDIYSYGLCFIRWNVWEPFLIYKQINI